MFIATEGKIGSFLMKDLMKELLILILIVSITGTMLTCARTDPGSGAAVFDVQNTASNEPVLGVVYTDTQHDADPTSGIAAMQTVQLRLLALSKENEKKQDGSLYIAVLLILSIIAGILLLRQHLRPDLSDLILRRRTVIIYIYSQDGAKA